MYRHHLPNSSRSTASFYPATSGQIEVGSWRWPSCPASSPSTRHLQWSHWHSKFERQIVYRPSLVMGERIRYDAPKKRQGIGDRGQAETCSAADNRDCRFSRPVRKSAICTIWIEVHAMSAHSTEVAARCPAAAGASRRFYIREAGSSRRDHVSCDAPLCPELPRQATSLLMLRTHS
jgi:hypothetical protein